MVLVSLSFSLGLLCEIFKIYAAKERLMKVLKCLKKISIFSLSQGLSFNVCGKRSLKDCIAMLKV